MANIELKTNGEIITANHQQLIKEWIEYLEEKMSVRTFTLNFYRNRTIFADCVLQNNHVGSFVITDKSVRMVKKEVQSYDYRRYLRPQARRIIRPEKILQLYQS